MTLEKTILELELNLEHFEQINTKISSKNVAWQIDHILRVIIETCKLLIKSDPTDYIWEFNKIKSAIFLTGIIPRGVAKAPKVVMTEGKVSLEDLKQQVEETKLQIEGLKNLPKKANFKHPYFGYLDLKESKKFLSIHSRHHLKIMKDIIEK